MDGGARIKNLHAFAVKMHGKDVGTLIEYSVLFKLMSLTTLSVQNCFYCKMIKLYTYYYLFCVICFTSYVV